MTETVEYSELRSDGDFNNTKIGVTVAVRDGETYEGALTRARQFVLEQMGDLKTIEDEIALLATAAQEAGLDVPEKLKIYDGIPF